jgi:hypothetical protein
VRRLNNRIRRKQTSASRKARRARLAKKQAAKVPR